MQTIYYNFNRKYLCDASGTAVSDLPEITFAEKPTWRIIPVNDSGTAVIPTGITTFRAAVKFDFNSATATAVRSVGEQITSSTAGIDVQLNANTEDFLTAVDGQETRDAFFELSGFDAESNRVFYLSFRVHARMILDPDLDNNLPEEVTSNFLDLSTAAVLLAGKTDNADFTALSGRVSSVETTLPGKADQSDVTALSGRVSSVETALPGKAPAADAVQPGCVAAFAGDASNIPAGYLLCNGSAVSRTDYAALFSAIGTTYGTGDGSTTFNLPDFRGKFLRGYLSGTSAALGTAQGDASRNITGLVGYIQTMHRETGGAYNTDNSAMYASDPSGGPVYYNVATNGSIGYNNINVNFDASRNTSFPTASENRPANYAVNYIIKY